MKDGREQRDRGLTLVEVSAVLLIMAVLMGIAIPTFRGARHQDADRTAQVNLLRAYSAARTALADDGTFENATYDKIGNIEPDLNYEVGVGHLTPPSGNSTASNEVSISVTGRCSLPYVQYQNSTQDAACVTGGSSYSWNGSTCTKPRRLTETWCKANGVADSNLAHTVWAAAVLSDSGKCFLLRHQIADLDAGVIVSGSVTSTTFPRDTKYATLTDSDDCDGDHAADPYVTVDDEW